MLVTIERSRIDPHNLYGLIVAESDYLIAIQRETDFQFDGFIFIRKRDVTKRIEGTESQRYHTSIMRKEGFWKTPPQSIKNLPLENWNELVLALADKPAMIENERKGDSWVGVLKGCTKTSAMIHYFSSTGVFDESIDRVPFRTITSLQYGDRYTSTHYKHLKPGRTKMMDRSARSRRAGMATSTARTRSS